MVGWLGLGVVYGWGLGQVRRGLGMVLLLV